MRNEDNPRRKIEINNLDNLIQHHKAFLIRTISNFTGKYVSIENDEAYSIGLAAFAEAVERYEETRGSFLSFARLVIESRHLWYTMAAAAAIFLLFITTFAMTHMQNRAYAEVSVDGNRSIQLSVNKKNIIVDARTKNEDLEKDLHQNLKGKKLNALPDYLVQENITSSGAVVGYAPVNQKEEKQMDRLQRTLERMMGTSDILYLRGTNEDLLAAKNSGKSLGTYLLSRSLQENLDGDNLLPVQPGQSEEDFIDFLKKQSGLLEDEDLSSAMEQIKEKITEKQNTGNKKQKKENKKNKDEDEVNAEDQEDAEEDEKTSVKQKETDNDKDDPEPEEEKESPSDEEQELSDDQDDD